MSYDTRMLFGVLLVAAGVVVVLLALRGLAELRRSRDWPAVRGEIVSSTVRRRITTPSSSPPTSHINRVEVIYRYQVQGEEYRGHIIELGGRFRQTPGMAIRQAAAYRPGQTVTVYHAPEQPDRACLVRGGGGLRGRLVAGIALIVVGATLLLFPGAEAGEIAMTGIDPWITTVPTTVVPAEFPLLAL